MTTLPNWTDLKAKIDALGLAIRYDENENDYFIQAWDDVSSFSCSLLYSDTSDKDDFELNYKADANLPYRGQTEIAEESLTDKTGGHFARKTLESSIPAGVAGDWTVYDFTFPYPVSMMAAVWPALLENDGDEVKVEVAPGTIVGVLTADAAISDTILNVQPSVTANMAVGFCATITDGVNTEEHIVTAVNKADGTITIEEGLTNAFAAATPTYIKMTVKLVPWMRLRGSGFAVEMGQSKIGGSYLPANKPIRVHYRNNTTAAKKFPVDVEILY